MKYKINREVLLDNGYKEYRVNKYRKRIFDENYNFIYNIDIEYFQMILLDNVHCGFEIKVKFRDCHTKDKELEIIINFTSKDMTIKEIEGIIHKQWKAIGSPLFGK